MLREAGYEARYRSTQDAWQEALAWPADLVIAAGGDGTVARVAAALLERGVPLGILPFGTANNVAKALGITRDGDAPTAARAWAAARARPFDIWRVTVDGGTATFVESIGGGFLGRQIKASLALEPPTLLLGNQMDRGLHLLRRAIAAEPEAHWGVELDGRDLSGRYIAVEALNIRSVGPNLPLAPDADSGDGVIDLVLVSGAHRQQLELRLTSLATAREPEALRLPVLRGRELHLEPPQGIAFHLDGDTWEPEPVRADGTTPGMSITLAGQVKVLRPA